MSARYWIAQHVPDVFRNEPRNIGVLVESRGLTAARFHGETASGRLDGRSLKRLPFPDVYRQWVDYWRGELAAGAAARLPERGASSYRVFAGGEVTDIGEDSPDVVAAYLYAKLVSEDARAASDGPAASDTKPTTLRREIHSAFMQKQLLHEPDGPAWKRHPVKHNAPIRGHAMPQHQPAFSQENGCLYVMEDVDFTGSQKKQACDRAGFAAYVVSDIRALRDDTQGISLVRVRAQDREHQDVRYGLSLLEAETEVVDWLDDDARGNFLAQREQIASQ